MNNDLISRSDLRKRILAFCLFVDGDNFCDYDIDLNDLIDLIDNAETVEPEVYMTAKDYNLYLEGYKQGKKDFDRPKGEWVEIEGGGYICPNCEDIEVYTPNYCPNCGAKMKDKKK